MDPASLAASASAWTVSDAIVGGGSISKNLDKDYENDGEEEESSEQGEDSDSDDDDASNPEVVEPPNWFEGCCTSYFVFFR